jgi:hypothetical protein
MTSAEPTTTEETRNAFLRANPDIHSEVYKTEFETLLSKTMSEAAIIEQIRFYMDESNFSGDRESAIQIDNDLKEVAKKYCFFYTQVEYYSSLGQKIVETHRPSPGEPPIPFDQRGSNQSFINLLNKDWDNNCNLTPIQH